MFWNLSRPSMPWLVDTSPGDPDEGLLDRVGSKA